MTPTNGTSASVSPGNGNDGNPPVPRPRAEWLARRKAENRDGNFSQMHYARQGLVTEEMVYVAEREKIAPELVRDEVARGRLIIPANIHHPELEPMGIRVAILRHSPVPIGTVPIYEAISRVKRVEDLTAALMLEVIEEQAAQGVDY